MAKAQSGSSAKAGGTSKAVSKSKAGATALPEGADPTKMKRGAKLRMAYRVAREGNPSLPWLLAAAFLFTLTLFLLLGLLIQPWWLYLLIGLPIAVLVTMIVFGRTAQKAVYGQMEGQLGAAAGVLDAMRGQWTVTPAVAVTRSQDVVHRVVGRCGVVLVGEGAATRLSSLFSQERKKLQRVAPDVPVTEMVVGRGPGEVPLPKLQTRMMKMPRKLKPASVAELDRRLQALGTASMPIPKGPLPKGARMPKGLPR